MRPYCALFVFAVLVNCSSSRSPQTGSAEESEELRKLAIEATGIALIGQETVFQLGAMSTYIMTPDRSTCDNGGIVNYQYVGLNVIEKERASLGIDKPG